MANTDREIAEAIQKAMDREKTNVNALALATGIPYNTLNRRVNTGRYLQVDELFIIAEALGMEVEDILAMARHHESGVAA